MPIGKVPECFGRWCEKAAKDTRTKEQIIADGVLDCIVQTHAGELDADARNIIKAIVIGLGVKGS